MFEELSASCSAHRGKRTIGYLQTDRVEKETGQGMAKSWPVMAGSRQEGTGRQTNRMEIATKGRGDKQERQSVARKVGNEIRTRRRDIE